MISVVDLYLKHFARVQTGLQVPELYIDFRLSHEFYMFVGKNGTGKTSILHCIHPFAYNTALGDTSIRSDIITEHQNGEKRIRYLINDIMYTIRHVYTRKSDDSLSVKSFFSQGDTELNPSGTVNTFEELVEEYFELDKTYLGLLSLGNTVKGFVDYTGGDRKQLVTKIFTKLNVFGRYYKNASNRTRTIKSVLNNVTAKLDKYSKYDKEEANKKLQTIDAQRGRWEEDKERILLERGKIHQKLLTQQDVLTAYNEKHARIMVLLDTIDHLKGKLHTQKDIPTLEADYVMLQKKIEECKIKHASYSLNTQAALDYVQNIKADLEETNKSIERMSQNIDLQELDALKASLEAKISSISLPKETIPFSKEYLIRAHAFLEQLQGLCIDFITEVRRAELVSDAATRYLKDHTLLKKSQGTYEKLLHELQQRTYVRNTQYMIDTKPQMPIVSDCKQKQTCAYARFYELYQETVEKTTGELDHALAQKREEVDVAGDLVKIGQITHRLQQFLKRNEELLDLPTEIFDPVSFVSLYMDKREVFQRDLLTSLIDLAEQQELKESLEAQLAELEQTRSNYQSLRTSYDAMKQRSVALEEKMRVAKNSVELYQKELPTIEAETKKLEQTQKKVQDAISLSKELETCRSEMTSLKKEAAAMEDMFKEVDGLQQQEKFMVQQLAELDKQLDELQTTRESICRTMSIVRDLEKEQLELMEQYGEAESVRIAVSPSKGIPLEYIKKYIKGDLIRMVNELLDLVYHGELYLDARRVKINEEEFTIPYVRRGTLVADISHASDGERAVMSLAFSLSLARITSKAYNILLLDEMDTSLDAYSRGKYIEMIVAYMKLIKCHQVFLISHNSMFDNYPVNVLLTSDMNVSNIKQADIVRLWERRVPA